MNRRHVFGVVGLGVPLAAAASVKQADAHHHSSPVTAMELGTRLCHALGLDPNAVSKLRFEFDAGDISKVHVEMVVLDSQQDGIVEVMKDYVLEEKV